MSSSSEFEQKRRQWEQALLRLPDDVFFKLIRVYLGKLETPYNKQRILERFGSFFMREGTRKNILSLLNENDLKVLTMIKTVKGVTSDNLEVFLSYSMPAYKCRELLESLEERCLVYTYDSGIRRGISKTRSAALALNPYLEGVLTPLLSKEIFFEKVPASSFLPVKIRLLPGVIAAAVSFVNAEGDIFKQSGELKKRAASDLAAVFGASFDEGFFVKLFGALARLNIIEPSGEGTSLRYNVNPGRLDLFAALSRKLEACYICAAAESPAPDAAVPSVAASPDNDDEISRGANAFMRMFNFMGGEIWASHSVFEGVHLISAQAQGPQRGAVTTDASHRDPFHDFADMVDTAAALGIIDRSSPGKDAFLSLHKTALEDPVSGGKFVSVDANLCITAATGDGAVMTLSDLVPLVKFAEIRKYDNAALTFEITRQSVFSAFNTGMTKEQIVSVLEELSGRSVPGSVNQLLDDWSEAYNTISLYKGYVLKVNAPDDFHAKAQLAPYIKEELAPNVFLLKRLTEAARNEVTDLISRFGRSLSVVDAEDDANSSSDRTFVSFEEAEQTSTDSGGAEVLRDVQKAAEAGNELLSDLRAHLDTLNMTDEQRSVLEDRIERRLIVDVSQLQADAVKVEALEAGGMDIMKKAHVFSVAIEEHNYVELRAVGITGLIKGIPLEIKRDALAGVVRIALVFSSGRSSGSVPAPRSGSGAPSASLDQDTAQSEEDALSVLELPIVSVMHVKILKKDHIFR